MRAGWWPASWWTSRCRQLIALGDRRRRHGYERGEIQADRTHPAGLITHRFPYTEAKEAYARTEEACGSASEALDAFPPHLARVSIRPESQAAPPGW